MPLVHAHSCADTTRADTLHTRLPVEMCRKSSASPPRPDDGKIELAAASSLSPSARLTIANAGNGPGVPTPGAAIGQVEPRPRLDRGSTPAQFDLQGSAPG